MLSLYQALPLCFIFKTFASCLRSIPPLSIIIGLHVFTCSLNADCVLHILLHFVAHHARASEPKDDMKNECIIANQPDVLDHVIDIQDGACRSLRRVVQKLSEKSKFRLEIFFDGAVIIEMVTRQICKDADVIFDRIDAGLIKRVTRHFECDAPRT